MILSRGQIELLRAGMVPGARIPPSAQMRGVADTALHLYDENERLEAERDAYRIESDCGLRDYDGLEVEAGELRDVLQQIAEGRPNKTFDPWARGLAREALAHAAFTGEEF